MSARRGIELQLRNQRSKVITTAEGKALSFGFKFGPIAVFCIANLPEDGESEGPLVYIKVQLTPDKEWGILKDHSKKDSTEYIED